MARRLELPRLANGNSPYSQVPWDENGTPNEPIVDFTEGYLYWQIDTRRPVISTAIAEVVLYQSLDSRLYRHKEFKRYDKIVDFLKTSISTDTPEVAIFAAGRNDKVAVENLRLFVRGPKATQPTETEPVLDSDRAALVSA